MQVIGSTLLLFCILFELVKNVTTFNGIYLSKYDIDCAGCQGRGESFTWARVHCPLFPLLAISFWALSKITGQNFLALFEEWQDIIFQPLFLM